MPPPAKLGPLNEKEKTEFDTIRYDDIYACKDVKKLLRLEAYMREQGFPQTADAVSSRLRELGQRAVFAECDPQQSRILAEEKARASAEIAAWTAKQRETDAALEAASRAAVGSSNAVFGPPVRTPPHPASDAQAAAKPAAAAHDKQLPKPKADSAVGTQLRSGRDYYERWEKKAADALEEIDRQEASTATASSFSASGAAPRAPAGVAAAAASTAGLARSPELTQRLLDLNQGLSPAERVALSNQEKAKGNEHFRAGEHAEAVEHYTLALGLRGAAGDPSLFSNRAAAYLKLKMYDAVEQDATAALEADPGLLKAWLRRAAARLEMGKWADVVADCDAALALAPESKDAADTRGKAVKQLEAAGMKRMAIEEVEDDEEEEEEGVEGKVASVSAGAAAATGRQQQPPPQPTAAPVRTRLQIVEETDSSDDDEDDEGPRAEAVTSGAERPGPSAAAAASPEPVQPAPQPQSAPQSVQPVRETVSAAAPPDREDKVGSSSGVSRGPSAGSPATIQAAAEPAAASPPPSPAPTLVAPTPVPAPAGPTSAPAPSGPTTSAAQTSAPPAPSPPPPAPLPSLPPLPPPPSPPPAASEAQFTAAVEAVKVSGNEAFKAGRLEVAVQRYSEALEIAPDMGALYLNRSMAALRQNQPAAALRDACLAVALDPGSYKALHKRARAKTLLQLWESARDDLQHCHDLIPPKDRVRAEVARELEEAEAQLAASLQRRQEAEAARMARPQRVTNYARARVVIEEHADEEEGDERDTPVLSLEAAATMEAEAGMQVPRLRARAAELRAEWLRRCDEAAQEVYQREVAVWEAARDNHAAATAAAAALAAETEASRAREAAAAAALAAEAKARKVHEGEAAAAPAVPVSSAAEPVPAAPSAEAPAPIAAAAAGSSSNGDARADVEAPAHAEAIDVEAVKAAGNAHLQAERYSEAEAAYRRCLAAAPDHLAVHLNMALLLNRVGRWTEAEQEADTAMRLLNASEGSMPCEQVDNMRSKVFHRRGTARRALGRLAEALEDLRAARGLLRQSAALDVELAALGEQMAEQRAAAAAAARAVEEDGAKKGEAAPAAPTAAAPPIVTVVAEPALAEANRSAMVSAAPEKGLSATEEAPSEAASSAPAAGPQPQAPQPTPAPSASAGPVESSQPQEPQAAASGAAPGQQPAAAAPAAGGPSSVGPSPTAPAASASGRIHPGRPAAALPPRRKMQIQVESDSSEEDEEDQERARPQPSKPSRSPQQQQQPVPKEAAAAEAASQVGAEPAPDAREELPRTPPTSSAEPTANTANATTPAPAQATSADGCGTAPAASAVPAATAAPAAASNAAAAADTTAPPGGADQAALLREKGNHLFRVGNYVRSLDFYNQSIRACAHNPAAYCNRSFVHLHLKRPAQALSDADIAIQQAGGDYPKAQMRRAMALRDLGRVVEAMAAVRELLDQAPGDPALLEELQKLQRMAPAGAAAAPAAPAPAPAAAVGKGQGLAVGPVTADGPVAASPAPAPSAAPPARRKIVVEEEEEESEEEVRQQQPVVTAGPGASSIAAVAPPADGGAAPANGKPASPAAAAGTKQPSATDAIPAGVPVSTAPASQPAVAAPGSSRTTIHDLASAKAAAALASRAPKKPNPPRNAHELEQALKGLSGHPAVLHDYIRSVDPVAYANIIKANLSVKMIQAFVDTARHVLEQQGGQGQEGSGDVAYVERALESLILVPRFEMTYGLCGKPVKEDVRALVAALAAAGRDVSLLKKSYKL